MYYIAPLDRKTNREILELRVEGLESGAEAAEARDILESVDRRYTYIVGYVPSAEEAATFKHVCRGCNCQFDRRGRLVEQEVWAMLDKARLLEAIANRRHVCKVVIDDRSEPSEAAKALWEWRLDALEEITTMIESGAYDAPEVE